jgi:hypothetical protein
MLYSWVMHTFLWSVCSWYVYIYSNSCILSIFDWMLSVCFCQVDMYSMQGVFCKLLFECCLSVFVRLICTIYSCVLSTFDCMFSECVCHVYVYYIQRWVVNLWLYVFCMFLSCLCVLYTAVSCQPLIVCFLYVFVWLICTPYSYVLSTFDSMLHEGFVTIIFILYSCVMIAFCLCSFVMSIYIIYSCVLSTFDCMLYVCCCMFICSKYNCVLSTFVCVFLLICNLYNAFYVLMLIIILYNISLVLNHLLKPIKCVNNESA